MRRLLFWAILLAFLPPAFSAPHSRDDDPSAFKVGALAFTLPAKWTTETPGTPVRAGQWRVPPVRGKSNEPGQVVAFYFGPGQGGTAKEITDNWMRTMFNAEGHPAAAEVKNREKNGAKITQVVAFGTYSEAVPIAGLPPVPRPDFGLIGAVVENAQGNIYWRFTGPEPLITANLPLFNKMIDSVRLQGK